MGKIDNTGKKRTKDFEATHKKVMLPNDVKAILDAKAKALGTTAVKLLCSLVTGEQQSLGTTPAVQAIGTLGTTHVKNQEQEQALEQPLGITPQEQVYAMLKGGLPRGYSVVIADSVFNSDYKKCKEALKTFPDWNKDSDMGKLLKNMDNQLKSKVYPKVKK